MLKKVFGVKVVLAIGLLVVNTLAIGAYNKTEDYWKCENKVGGSWNFGRAPYACDVSAVGDDSHANEVYAPVIFDDNVSSKTERNRYMTELYAFVKAAAKYYYLERVPGATANEIAAWQQAAFTIAHQESFWSHYRLADDAKLKMMRGDYGHGHGMMQVDDRWHFVAINDSAGWRLIDNLFYALEEYYGGWKKAATESCVSSASNWRDRSRAAYSYYNGGPSKICRWTNPDDKWARNDTGFADKYDNKQWETYVSDMNHVSPIAINCIANGNDSCQSNPEPEPGVSWEGKLLNLSDGNACVFSQDQLHCVGQIRDAACLTLVAGYDVNNALNLTDAEIANVQKNVYDRHECSANMKDLYAVGQFIKLKKNINMRAEPGGSKVTTSKSGQVYQVLDFELKDQDSLKRYYQISHDGKMGYVYGGDKHNYNDWAELASQGNDVIIPVKSNYIKVSQSSGINLRTTPGGTKIATVPHDTVAEIINTLAKGDDNAIYYELEYHGKQGYIYGGHLLPEQTLGQWAALSEAEIPAQMRAGVGGDNLWYVKLKTCAGESCSNTSHYVFGGLLEDLCNRWSCSYKRDLITEMVSADGDWVQVRVSRDGGEGWIKDSEIDWN